MTIVSEFVASLGVQTDSAQFGKANQALDGLFGRAGKLVTVFGTLFAGREIVNYFKDVVAAGDRMNDAITRTGIAGQSLQALGLAAEENGSSLEELEFGLKFLQRNSQTAAEGSKELSKAFTQLGYSSAQLKKGVPTEELLGALADRMEAVTDPAKRTALAMQLLGRSGQALVPFLAQGRAGLDKLKERFAELGGGLSDDFIQKADEVNDKLAEMHVATQSLASTLGSSLVPAITKIVVRLTEWAIAFRKLVEGNQFLQYALYLTTAAFVAWGVAMLWASAGPKLGILAAIAAIAAAFDDIRTALIGGKSLIGEWIDSWFGLGTIEKLVRGLAKALEYIAAGRWFQGTPLDKWLGKKAASDVRESLEAQIADANKDALSSDELTRARGNRRLKRLNARMAALQAGGQLYDRENPVAPLDESDQRAALPGQVSAATVNDLAKQFKHLLPEGAQAVTNSEGATVIVPKSADGIVRLPQVNIAGGGPQASTPSQNLGRLPPVNVTIHARTGASAKEIGHHAKTAVREALDQKAQDIRRSYGRRPQSENALPVGGDPDVEGIDE